MAVKNINGRDIFDQEAAEEARQFRERHLTRDCLAGENLARLEQDADDRQAVNEP